MSPPAARPADPPGILAAFNRAGVDYVVVGGWAVVVYGVDRATFDLDLVVSAEKANVAALATALGEVDARRDLGAGLSEELNLDDAGVLLAGPLRLRTRNGPLDILTRVPGLSFEELRADARRATFGDGTEFVVASKPALEAIKTAIADEADPARGGRDRADLEQLRALPDPDLPPA
jgi:hypothetical protein